MYTYILNYIYYIHIYICKFFEGKMLKLIHIECKKIQTNDRNYN